MIDPAYLDLVRRLPSCISGRMDYDPDAAIAGCQAHHIVGHGMRERVKVGKKVSRKACDYLTMPLTYDEHGELHRGHRTWESKHGSQWVHVIRTREIIVARYGILLPPLPYKALEFL